MMLAGSAAVASYQAAAVTVQHGSAHGTVLCCGGCWLFLFIMRAGIIGDVICFVLLRYVEPGTFWAGLSAWGCIH